MILFGLSAPDFQLFHEVQWQCHLVVVIGSSHRRRAKSPIGTVLIINLLGKGLTPRACMGDGGSIWWAPDQTEDKELKKIFLETASPHLISRSGWPGPPYLKVNPPLSWQIKISGDLISHCCLETNIHLPGGPLTFLMPSAVVKLINKF